MTDTPTKPKPGSLRDRIAAFEKDAAAASSAPKQPLMRPKPGHVTWKPAPPSPSASDGGENDDKQRHGAMSANDAKESIGAGGSLKERMAALQGKVAFGGVGTGAPLPGPKPMKRPPLISPLPEDESENSLKQQSQAKIFQEDVGVSDTADEEDPAKSLVMDQKDRKEEELVEEDQDEETRERERRAAIAARMARLGGARIGMAPPVVGRKPEKPKHPEPSEEKATEPSSTSSSADLVEFSTPPLKDQAETVIEFSEADTVLEENITPPTDALSKPEHEGKSSNELRSVAATDDVLTSLGLPPGVPFLSSSPQSDIQLKMPSGEQSITTHPASSQVSLSSSHSSLQSVPLPAMPRRPQGPPRHKGSSRSMQSDTKAEETKTEATLEKSMQDTADIPLTGPEVPERLVSDETVNVEESHPKLPEAALDTTASSVEPHSTPSRTSSQHDAQAEHEPRHEPSIHTHGTDAIPVSSPQAVSMSEIVSQPTPETVTTPETQASSVVEHKEPVVDPSQVQQPGMPIDIEHDSSDTINPVIEHVENIEGIEDT